MKLQTSGKNIRRVVKEKKNKAEEEIRIRLRIRKKL